MPSSQLVTTSQSVVNMMKEDFAEKIFLHMNLSSTELQIFQLKTRALNGKHYRVNFQTGGNSRLEPRAEGEYLPGFDTTSTFQDRIPGLNIEEMKFGRRQVYASVDFTGPMAAAVKSKEGGYSNIMEYRFKDTERHLVEQVGRALAYGEHSIVGRIKAITNKDDATAIVHLYAANEVGDSAGTTVAIPEVGNRLIRQGMVLDAVNGSAGGNGTGRLGAVRQAHDKDRGRRVTAVSADNSAPTVTFNTAGSDLDGNSWDVDDYLVLHKSRRLTVPASAADSEVAFYGPRGILDMVDDGTLNPYYGQLDRTSYQSLMCQRLGNSASPGTLRGISLDLINLAVEQSETVADGRPDVIYCTPAIRRQLVKFLTATVATGGNQVSDLNPTRYNNPGAEKVIIGVNKFDVLTLGPTGRMTIMSSRLAPAHMLIMIQRDTALLFQDSAPTFINEDGLKVRLVDGKDEFTALWKWYVPGIICREPWKNVRIDDVEGSHLA